MEAGRTITDAVEPEQVTTGAESTWGSLATAGLIVAAIGTAMPWFTVGPASQLGVQTLGGRFTLALVVVSAGLAVATRLRPDPRLGIALGATVAVAIVVAVVGALRPPASMSPTLGIPLSLVGLAAVAATNWKRTWTALTSR